MFRTKILIFFLLGLIRIATGQNCAIKCDSTTSLISQLAGSDNTSITSSAGWHGQSITISDSSYITSFKMMAYRLGIIGNGLFQIRSTTGDPALPTETIISSVTIPYSNVGLTSYDTLTVNFSDTVLYAPGVYAVVWNWDNLSSGTRVFYEKLNSSASYTGGRLIAYSSGSWSSNATFDYIFKIMGCDYVECVEITGTPDIYIKNGKVTFIPPDGKVWITVKAGNTSVIVHKF